MDASLKKKIELLLINASLKFNKHASNYTYDNSEVASIFGAPSSVGGLIADSPEDWHLSNEHALLLIKLSQQLSKKETEELNAVLLSRIVKGKPHGIVDAVSSYFVHTNQAELLLDHVSENLFTYNNNGACLRCLEDLTEAMKHRPDIFGSSVTEKILDYADDYLNGRTKLGEEASEFSSLYRDITTTVRGMYTVANEILFKEFAKQIDTAFNPELNVDESKVIEEITALGFPLDLTEQLRYISDLIDTANDPKQYRTVMSAIRVFTERFYEQVAKTLEPATKVDGKDADRVARLFNEKRLLSNDMAELLKAHRHFLSNDGTHRIKSRKEDARIAKNMTIELSLYVITRLRELQGAEK